MEVADGRGWQGVEKSRLCFCAAAIRHVPLCRARKGRGRGAIRAFPSWEGSGSRAWKRVRKLRKIHQDLRQPARGAAGARDRKDGRGCPCCPKNLNRLELPARLHHVERSEEHTSELQSQFHLVC